MNPLGRAAVVVSCSLLAGRLRRPDLLRQRRRRPDDDAEPDRHRCVDGADAERRRSTPPSTTATAAPSPDVLTLEGIASGAPPSVPYLAATDAGWSLVRPDGADAQPCPARTTRSRRWATGSSARRRSTTWRRRSSSTATSRRSRTPTNPSGSLAVTPDGAIVGWLTTDGQPARRGARRQPGVGPAGRATRPVRLAALVSDGDTCKEGDGGQRVRGLRELRRRHERPVGDLPRHRRHHAGRPGRR